MTKAIAWRAELAHRKAAHERAGAELAMCGAPVWSKGGVRLTIREAGGLIVEALEPVSDAEALAMARWILEWFDGAE